MQHVELRCIGDRGIRRQPQSLDVANRVAVPAVNAIGRVRNPRQHLEWTGEVDLIEPFEQQGTDLQMGVMRDHGQLRKVAMDNANLTGQALAEMPKSPRSPPRPQPGAARIVEVLAYPAVQLLDVTGPLQVFATANEMVADAGGAPPHVLRVVAKGGPGVTSSAGLEIAAGPLPRMVAALDTLIVAGGPGVEAASADPALVDWVRRRAGRARRVASVCTGAFLLAASGVLDGRRAATHWSVCAEFARRFPAVRVEPDPIFVRDGSVWTSAGVTAGIDLALALVEQDLGRTAALAVARYLVVFLKRPGGQAQFSATLSLQTAEDRFGTLHDWIGAHLT